MARAPRLLSLTAGLLFAAACETVVDPAPPNSAMTPATHAAFFQIATGPHAVDCNTCHSGFKAFTGYSCFGCHGHEQPATDALHANVDSYTYASTACYACHQSSGGTGGGVGVPPGLVRDPGRDVTVQALVPSYAGTSIATLSPQTEALPMPMAHATTQVAAASLVSCSNCHNAAVSGSYFPGTLHSALANLSLPAPTGCTDCHATSRPQGLVGPTATAPARTPPSGEMKHDAVAWVNGKPTQTALVTQDCILCHLSPGATLDAKWGTSVAGKSPAQFHAALATAQVAQPASCLDCHANSRPAGVLTSGNAALPASLTFDHGATAALADCTACHAASAPQWTTWQGGRFHLAGSSAPASCLPCHEGERPTSVATWKSPGYAAVPFDYVVNAQGVGHGDGQDCASCHTGPGAGAWGATPDWTGGHFGHGAASVAGTTCFACHTTQRPDLQPGVTAAGVATQLGFDHSINGTGDCFGCHQATVVAGNYAHYNNPATGTLPGGDWKGAQSYPGGTLVGSPNEFITITETTLTRNAQGLVTGSAGASATLYNEMLHISAAVPAELSPGSPTAPDNTRCWHCHTNKDGAVTAYSNGEFHPSLTNFRTTPGGTVSALPQPTSQCRDCHIQMRPVGVVQRGGSDLLAMDHSAQFTAAVSIGGVSVTGVPGMDCSSCHRSPGSVWGDGAFHPNIAGATPVDCTQCHYLLMADGAKADVTASTLYAMKHRSAQVTIQTCQTCHTAALGRATSATPAANLWLGGAFHLNGSPTSCLDCHTVSAPGTTQSGVSYSFSSGGTSTNAGQWMSHASASVVGKDCVTCHASDAGLAWSKTASFHARVSQPAGCQSCHGVQNGAGASPGSNNNLPLGLTNSSTISSAGGDPTTQVPAGTPDQISHADVNVTAHDCNFCHTQSGPSTAGGVQGREWAQAKFHANFGNSNPLLMNAGSGRCSNCHINVKPGSGFAGYNHSALTATSAQDCASCHSWPGSGTASSPNWLGAGGGVPTYISVGGFVIPSPPGSNNTQGGINNLPHPTVATGTACTTCHATSAGGKGAHAYPHNASLDSNCNACHEAGTNLLGGLWNNVTSQGSGAGDSRPYTLSSVVATKGSGGGSFTVRTPNHFYPVNCNECHVVPSGTAQVTTGGSYNNAWTFPHTKSRMSNPSTCNFCH